MKNQIDRFTCEQVFERLDDYLDRELAPREMQLIEEHLEICAWCAREFNYETSVLYGLKRKLRQLDAPEDLLSRILSRLPPGDDQP